MLWIRFSSGPVSCLKKVMKFGVVTSSWKPPPTDSFKINVDGSTGKQCAVTTLIRDHKGVFIQGEKLKDYIPMTLKKLKLRPCFQTPR